MPLSGVLKITHRFPWAPKSLLTAAQWCDQAYAAHRNTRNPRSAELFVTVLAHGNGVIVRVFLSVPYPMSPPVFHDPCPWPVRVGVGRT